MNKLMDRIAYSIIGLLVLIVLEGIFTLGIAFRFEDYNWFAWMIQVMFMFIAVWTANKIHDAD